MLKKLFNILIVTALCSSFSDEISYFKIGEDELSGVDIYDLYQDKNKIYWIATNNGIYKYNGYQFENKNCPQSVSSSFFNLKADNNGTVYFNNLSGQIFKIEKDSCVLHYTIPEKMMSPEVNFNFNDSNQLTILTNQVFKVNPDNSTETILKKEEGYFVGGLFKKKDGNLLVYNSHKRLFYEINSKGIEKEFYINKGETFTDFFYLRDTLYAFDSKQKKVYQLRNKMVYESNIEVNQASRFYSDNTFLWQVNLSGGCQLLNTNNEKRLNKVFSNIIISAFIQDHESNTLLGTFGQGIIMIPNMYAYSVVLPESEKAVRLSKSNIDRVYFGTQSGKIYSYSKRNGVSPYQIDGVKHIECLYYSHSNKCLIVDNSVVKFIFDSGNVKEVGLGAIKDVFELSTGELIIATNRGVKEVSIEDQRINSRQISAFKERTNTIGFDENLNIFYVGSSQGLRVGNEEEAEFFELEKGKPILARDILVDHDKTFIATQNQGIIIFKNGEFYENWNKNSGFPSKNVSEILKAKNDLLISTDQGVYLVDKLCNTKKKIGYAEGLYSLNPLDICFHDNTLYVVHSKGVQFFGIDFLKEDIEIPEIRLIKVSVNDQVLRDKLNNEFSYDKNRLKFYLRSPSLKFQKEIKYQYKLSGIDTEWQTNSFNENKIEYKSLPADEYTFEYRIKLRGKEGEIKKYAFVITKPYWETWWFYGIIAGFLFLSIYLFYKAKLNRQAKLTKFERELIASKLRAIQSQMNPHFIFNSLNSIQDLVLQQDGQNAYVYISKFAYLVRKVLHHSDEEFIEIDEELKLLNVYLELEELRFKEDFEFSISSEGLEGIEVPPMLVQPFIENAIKHGLLHKKGLKTLSILFQLEDNQLHCVITDNGIGRAASAEINKRKSKHHESFSVKSIRSRFEILQDMYGDGIGIEITDLYENDKPSGTKVDLKIPYRRKY